MFLWHCLSPAVVVPATGLLPVSGVRGQVSNQGSGRREWGRSGAPDGTGWRKGSKPAFCKRQNFANKDNRRPLTVQECTVRYGVLSTVV